MAIPTAALLGGSQLPARWRRRRTHVVLDLDFGSGEHFLALWQAWLHDRQRCDRLLVVAVAAEAPTHASLARALLNHPSPALAQQWVGACPPAVAGWHPLVLDGGRVRLTLRLGPGRAAQALRELPLLADTIILGPRAPLEDPRALAKAVARSAALGATLVAEGLSPGLPAALVSAGFQFAEGAGPVGGASVAVGQHAPRFVPRARVPERAGTTAREALVIGAGLAGAATAAALAGWGWSTRVLDRQPMPAAGASGNAAGLYHGIVHGSDGPHASLFRAAALFAQRCYEPLIAKASVAGGRGGLLRLADDDPLAMQARLDSQRLPAAHVQALDRAAASKHAGVPLPGPAWWYPGGGWLSPAALVRHWLQTPGVEFQGGLAVATIRPGGPGWQALDGEGRVLAQASVLVLAGAEACPQLLAPHGLSAWPLQRSRGQVSGWTSGRPHALRLPVAGDGYALPLSADGLLCGATTDVDDEQAEPRDADDTHNFARLERLTGLTPPIDATASLRRVGWRLQSGDRLPIAGALAAPAASGAPIDRLDRMPRTQGLFVLTALGSRGITLAPLLGELIATQIEGVAWPLERRLVDAVDPARWHVRAARRAQAVAAR
jgi:tRNA 5-methylaminomethyl-2-thiouridine biosynthesis bifunctional protein